MNELQNAGWFVLPFPRVLFSKGVMLPGYLFVTKAVMQPMLKYFVKSSQLFSLPRPNSQSEEEEEVFGIPRRSSLGLSGYPLTEEEPGTGEPGPGGPYPRPLRRIISIEEDPLPQLLDGGFEQPLSKCPEEEEVSDQGVQGQIQEAPPLRLTPTSPRGQPVGKEALCKVRAHPTLVHGRRFYDPSLAFEAKRPERQLRRSDAAGPMIHHICLLQMPLSPA